MIMVNRYLYNNGEVEELLHICTPLWLQIEFLNSVISDLQNKLEGVEAMKGLHGHIDSSSEYVYNYRPDNRI